MNRRKSIDGSRALTIVGPGTHLSGEITSQGTIRVEGRVTGRVQSEDTVIVQETGHVKADVIAKHVVISGEVHGNVYALERIEIMAKGKLIGDIAAPRVSIAEGVLFEGRCSMTAPGDTPVPATAASANQPAPNGLKTSSSEMAI